MFNRTHNRLVKVLNILNPFHKEGLLERLKTRLFPHEAATARRKRFIFFALLFILINLGIYYGAFKEYESFAYNVKDIEQITSNVELSSLRELFSNSYGMTSDTPTTPYTYLSIISVILLVTFIEYLALHLAYQYFAKSFTKIVKSILIFITVHALYLTPLILLVAAETHAVDGMLAHARAEVVAAQSAISNQADPSITYDLETAVTTIASSSAPIYLLSGDFDQDVLITSLNIEAKDSFYRAAVLPFVVLSDNTLSIPHEVILFTSHKLAISPKISQMGLQRILSTLALHSLKLSEIKDKIVGVKDPKISFLEESEYNELENKKIEQRKAQYLAYLSDISKNIKQNNQYITDTERAIANLKNDKSSYEARVRPLLAECINTYGETECAEPRDIINRSVADYDAEISQAESYLAEAKSLVPVLSRQYSLAKESYEQFLDYPITPELQAGLFEPPANIFIKYLSGESSHTPANYYYTLLHELVHYYSYSPKDDTPLFIEEGITDLLALRVGGENSAKSGKVDGYPQEIQVAERLFDILGQDEAKKLFFAKSKSGWQRELDKVCGKGCYKELEDTATQLTYAPVGDIENRTSLTQKTLSILGSEQ